MVDVRSSASRLNQGEHVLNNGQSAFAIVMARDGEGVVQKDKELRELGLSHVIICGENMELENVIFRPPRGKYDAANFALQKLPKDTQIVVLNDVDTKIVNFENGLRHFRDPSVGLVFARVQLPQGAASIFNDLIDAIRHRFLIAGSGELMFVKRELIDKIAPLKPCKAEDSLILFQTLKLGYRVVFDPACYVVTSRTSTLNLKNEEIYKRKVVCGLYQALYWSRGPNSRIVFYALLPFASPLLLVYGKKGWFWMRGILLGLMDFLKGDRSGYWASDYK